MTRAGWLLCNGSADLKRLSWPYLFGRARRKKKEERKMKDSHGYWSLKIFQRVSFRRRVKKESREGKKLERHSKADKDNH